MGGSGGNADCSTDRYAGVIYLIFGRAGFKPPWQDRGHSYEDHPTETALDILKKRYAKGEIAREEFEQMKRKISD